MQNRHKPQKPVSRAAISVSTIQQTGTDQSTGIYQRVTRNIGTAEEMGEYVKRFDLATTLDRIEKWARHILAEHGYDSWPVRIKTQKEFNMPDGTKQDFEGVKSIPGGNSILNDADEALLRIKYVRDALSDGEAKTAVLNAFFLGLITERMQVRPFESHALRGRRVKQGQNASRERRAEKTCMLKRRIVERWMEIDEQTGGKAKTIDKQVALEMPCSASTVMNARREAGLIRRR